MRKERDEKEIAMVSKEVNMKNAKEVRTEKRKEMGTQNSGKTKKELKENGTSVKRKVDDDVEFCNHRRESGRTSGSTCRKLISEIKMHWFV